MREMIINENLLYTGELFQIDNKIRNNSDIIIKSENTNTREINNKCEDNN